MPEEGADKKRLSFPVVSLAAEYLTVGYLMRRNILAYKAPPGQEGYDLICIHPDPKEKSKTVRVQVKSRYQTDSGCRFNCNSPAAGIDLGGNIGMIGNNHARGRLQTRGARLCDRSSGPIDDSSC